MNKTIDQLTEKSAVAVNDEFIVFDPSDGITKKVKASNMQVPFQYSTEEKFTGKYWVDGKPIYTRYFNIPITTYSDASSRRTFAQETSISNIDNLISAQGNLLKNTSSGSSQQILSSNSMGSSMEMQVALLIDYESSTSKLYTSAQCATYIGWTSVEFKIAIEYTKTTDQAQR